MIKNKINFTILISTLLISYTYSDRYENKRNSILDYPYITGPGFRSIATFVFPTNEFSTDEIKDGDIIYIQRPYDGDINTPLDKFFAEIHPKIKNQYILITHSAALDMPRNYLKYVDDPNLYRWFGENITIKHPKLSPLPIGIHEAVIEIKSVNEKIKAIARTRDGRCFDLDRALKEINKKNHYARFFESEKKYLVHCNFSLYDFRKINPPGSLYHQQAIDFYNERILVKSLFMNQSWCFNKNQRSEFDEYIQEMHQSKFTLSPRGIGLDCWRTWEALMCGCIPIVRTSSLDELFEDLPVLIITDWNQITPEFLEQKWLEMSKKTYNWDKIYIDYWLRKISKCPRKIKSKD